MTAGSAVFAAVGTVSAVALALWEIKTERQARRRREHRAQAERVSAWPIDGDESETPIALQNGSQEPVYRVVATLVFIQGAAPQTGREVTELGLSQYRRTLTLIPPGRYETRVAGGWGGMMTRPAVELAFTDRSGVHWLRTGDGTLVEIPAEPVSYYGLEQPLDWSIPVSSDSATASPLKR